MNYYDEQAVKDADRYGINIDKIEDDTQKANKKFGLNYEINPRTKFHLDTTKIAWHRDRVEALKNGEKIAPILVDMALTQNCNLGCSFCYAGLQQNESSPVTWETYENLLNDFVSIGHKPGEGVKAVSLVSDGESTLNPYFYKFVKKAKELGLDVACGTNGTRLKQEEIPEMVKCLTYLRFNVSAGEPETYRKVMGARTGGNADWEGMLRNVSLCVKAKKETGSDVTIGLQMVLLPEYADQVIPLAILGRELCVDYTIIKHCSDDEKGSLGVDYSFYKSNLAQQLLKNAEALSTPDYSVQAKWSKMKTGRDRKYSKCFGTPLLLQISGSSLVAPCGSFFHKDYKNRHIGNFAEKRFKDIWASDRYWEVINALKSTGFNPQHDCQQLCLQDKINESLWDYFELGNKLPDVSDKPLPMHFNFI